MDIYRIIRELLEERNRVDKIIASLDEMASEGRKSPSEAGRGRRGRKSMDAAARREVSERMKRYWAKRRVGQALPPVHPSSPEKP
ncbi:MAG: hypothetical protein ABSB15_00770 [Bryobacteraceae bacterium]|jgi:hypothetical protein